MEKAHRIIKFKQEAWLIPNIDTKTELKKNAKNDFEKYFFKLMNNAVFRKKNGKWDKNRDIKHVTTESRRNYLASEPNYCTTKKFSENFLAIEMRREITNIHE